MTRKQYEEHLNEIGTPDADLKSNGGRIPDRANYGTWTRRHDPIAFNVGFQERNREEAFRRREHVRLIFGKEAA